MNSKKHEKKLKRAKIVKKKLEARRQWLRVKQERQKQELEREAELDREARELNRLVSQSQRNVETTPTKKDPTFDKSAWTPKPASNSMSSILKQSEFDRSVWKVRHGVDQG